RRSARVVGGHEQPVADRLQADEVETAARREAECPHDAVRRVEDGSAEMRAEDRAAVREGGVGDGELQRRDGQVALADRHVDGVTDVPCARGTVDRPLEPARSADEACRLTGYV